MNIDALANELVAMIRDGLSVRNADEGPGDMCQKITAFLATANLPARMADMETFYQVVLNSAFGVPILQMFANRPPAVFAAKAVYDAQGNPAVAILPAAPVATWKTIFNRLCEAYNSTVQKSAASPQRQGQIEVPATEATPQVMRVLADLNPTQRDLDEAIRGMYREHWDGKAFHRRLTIMNHVDGDIAHLTQFDPAAPLVRWSTAQNAPTIETQLLTRQRELAVVWALRARGANSSQERADEYETLDNRIRTALSGLNDAEVMRLMVQDNARVRMQWWSVNMLQSSNLLPTNIPWHYSLRPHTLAFYAENVPLFSIIVHTGRNQLRFDVSDPIRVTPQDVMWLGERCHPPNHARNFGMLQRLWDDVAAEMEDNTTRLMANETDDELQDRREFIVAVLEEMDRPVVGTPEIQQAYGTAKAGARVRIGQLVADVDAVRAARVLRLQQQLSVGSSSFPPMAMVAPAKHEEGDPHRVRAFARERRLRLEEARFDEEREVGLAAVAAHLKK